VGARVINRVCGSGFLRALVNNWHVPLFATQPAARATVVMDSRLRAVIRLNRIAGVGDTWDGMLTVKNFVYA